MVQEPKPDYVKIFFEPPDNPEEAWHTTVESMWAKSVPQSGVAGGLVYELDNSPWYVFGVSNHDRVCAELRHEVFEEPEHAEFDVLYFTKVWQHSGRSTYTLFLQAKTTLESAEWNAYWATLERLGCSYEGANGKLLALDVAAGADLDAIEEVLEKALAAEVFAYQTQHRYSPEVTS